MINGGTAKTVQWIMGVVALLLVGACCFIVQGIYSEQQSQKASQLLLVERIALLGDRMVRLEARIDTRRERENDINDRLKAIETKVDSLLRRQRLDNER